MLLGLMLGILPVMSMDNGNNNMVFGMPFLGIANNHPMNDEMIRQRLIGRAKRQLALDFDRPKKTDLPPRKSKKKRIY